MRKPTVLLMIPLLLGCSGGPDPKKLDGYKLVFEDDFEGSRLNTDVWTYEKGNRGGWGNQELEYYTEENASVKDGILTITAKREEKEGFHFTSSRIKTAGKAYITYGRIEARIKLSAGNALWPAFWMMPEKNNGWPKDGEIDIMENKGSDPYSTSSALHYLNSASEHEYQVGSYSWNKRANEGSIEDWHVYALVWDEEGLTFYVDEHEKLYVPKRIYHSRGGVYEGDGNEPFNKDFYVILNLAVGGNFDSEHAEPDKDFVSATMEVDYVRMYAFE